ncbi:MAG: hypothetical protein M1814_001416 [Vezdaea aestivalis]|nr:MAG: hypothetical protein M1814_001416 [Vezdaea aestivalis]
MDHLASNGDRIHFEFYENPNKAPYYVDDRDSFSQQTSIPTIYPIGHPSNDSPGLLPLLGRPSTAPPHASDKYPENIKEEWQTKEDFDFVLEYCAAKVSFSTFLKDNKFSETDTPGQFTKSQVLLLMAICKSTCLIVDCTRFLSSKSVEQHFRPGQSLTDHTDDYLLGRVANLLKDYYRWLRSPKICDVAIPTEDDVDQADQAARIDVHEIADLGTFAWWRAQAYHLLMKELGITWYDGEEATLSETFFDESGPAYLQAGRRLPPIFLIESAKDHIQQRRESSTPSWDSIALHLDPEETELQERWGEQFNANDYKGPTWDMTDEQMQIASSLRRSALTALRHLREMYYAFVMKDHPTMEDKPAILRFILSDVEGIKSVLAGISKLDALLILLLDQRIESENRYCYLFAGDEFGPKRVSIFSLFDNADNFHQVSAVSRPHLEGLRAVHARLFSALFRDSGNGGIQIIERMLNKSIGFRLCQRKFVGRPWRQLYFTLSEQQSKEYEETIKLLKTQMASHRFPSTFLDFTPVTCDDPWIEYNACSLCQENFSAGFFVRSYCPVPHDAAHLFHPGCLLGHMAQYTFKDQPTCPLCRTEQGSSELRAGLPKGRAGFGDPAPEGTQSGGASNREPVGLMYLPLSIQMVLNDQIQQMNDVDYVSFRAMRDWISTTTRMIPKEMEKIGLQWTNYGKLSDPLTESEKEETERIENLRRVAVREQRAAQLLKQRRARSLNMQYRLDSGQTDLFNRIDTSRSTGACWVYNPHKQEWESLYTGGWYVKEPSHRGRGLVVDRLLKHGSIAADILGDGRIIRWNRLTKLWRVNPPAPREDEPAPHYMVDKNGAVDRVGLSDRRPGAPYDGMVREEPAGSFWIFDFIGLRTRPIPPDFVREIGIDTLRKTTGQRRWRLTPTGLVDFTPMFVERTQALRSSSAEIDQPTENNNGYSDPPDGQLIEWRYQFERLDYPSAGGDEQIREQHLSREIETLEPTWKQYRFDGQSGGWVELEWTDDLPIPPFNGLVVQDPETEYYYQYHAFSKQWILHPSHRDRTSAQVIYPYDKFAGLPTVYDVHYLNRNDEVDLAFVLDSNSGQCDPTNANPLFQELEADYGGHWRRGQLDAEQIDLAMGDHSDDPRLDEIPIDPQFTENSPAPPETLSRDIYGRRFHYTPRGLFAVHIPPGLGPLPDVERAVLASWSGPIRPRRPEAQVCPFRPQNMLIYPCSSQESPINFFLGREADIPPYNTKAFDAWNNCYVWKKEHVNLPGAWFLLPDNNNRSGQNWWEPREHPLFCRVFRRAPGFPDSRQKKGFYEVYVVYPRAQDTLGTAKEGDVGHDRFGVEYCYRKPLWQEDFDENQSGGISNTGKLRWYRSGPLPDQLLIGTSRNMPLDKSELVPEELLSPDPRRRRAEWMCVSKLVQATPRERDHWEDSRAERHWGWFIWHLPPGIETRVNGLVIE